MNTGIKKWDIGTPGYYSIGSDTYPITIIGKTRFGYLVQFDHFEGDKAAGHNYFGIQKWKFSRNPNGRTMEVTWKPKWERWSEKGGGGGVRFGEWHAHQDPSF